MTDCDGVQSGPLVSCLAGNTIGHTMSLFYHEDLEDHEDHEDTLFAALRGVQSSLRSV